MMAPNETAGILIQALPYIRRFTGKTIVVKVGGLPMTDPERMRSLAKDILLLHSVGIRPVLVHGGGPQIDQMMASAGIEVKRIDGLRVTDAQSLEIVRMVLVGKTNRDLVAAINALEPVAIGVAGEDGRLLEVEPVDERLGFVGRVTKVRGELLHDFHDDGLIPVVSTVGADTSAQPYNINADDAARAIAVAMGAEKIIYLTGTAGLLRDPADPSTLVQRLSAAEARQGIEEESVTGGMIPKLLACAEAVEGGVKSAHMIDGRAEHAILVELFTDEGIGTMICNEDQSPR
ncbi:acetylglutamate kinase [Sphingomonas rhizophila]|uniref:Acetylglutamate kinase n=1 Tax=Sphingomonas rhizophila TaxID=2071607 RepID=A0A7G9SAY2_9SPHN|nr:acetylglutamate kinase [Sphingomonas rhizophila]QNN65007.1 acetylglutamate kinase [Sphingomonas rhizophila]